MLALLVAKYTSLSNRVRERLVHVQRGVGKMFGQKNNGHPAPLGIPEYGIT
jgi:hypothetical protein